LLGSCDAWAWRILDVQFSIDLRVVVTGLPAAKMLLWTQFQEPTTEAAFRFWSRCSGAQRIENKTSSSQEDQWACMILLFSFLTEISCMLSCILPSHLDVRSSRFMKLKALQHTKSCLRVSRSTTFGFRQHLSSMRYPRSF
jgi:hypothetical protein